jgi:hypothetical protein
MPTGLVYVELQGFRQNHRFGDVDITCYATRGFHMAYSYYVYYRIDRERAAECEQTVLELLNTVKQATGVTGRLLKKRAEPLLWMEVYENVRDDAKFEAQLAEAVSRLKLEDYLQDDSSRRVECFET